MNKIKKSLKIAGIATLCCLILNAISIYADLYYYKFNLLYLIIDCMALLVTIGTGIFYLFMSKKEHKYLIAHYNWFSVVSLLNIINIFIIWILAFWIQIVVVKESKKVILQSQNSAPQYERTYVKGNDIILGQDDYIVRDQMDNLTNELNALNEQRNKNLITEEEYQILKQQCINKYMSSNKN